MHITELETFLAARGIPLDQWGRGEAKTLEHLLDEINSGESVLTEEHGLLVRSAEGGALNVFHHDGLMFWVLYEDRQVFADGRERVRNLNTSIGEKMKRGEDPLESAYRALSEELGIHEPLNLVPKPTIVKEPVPSSSFPGLHTRYTMYVYDVFIPTHLYRPEGYVEHQKDKSSYFLWKRHPDPGARA